MPESDHTTAKAAVLSSEKAFEIYQGYVSSADSHMANASLIALGTIGLKLMGVKVTDLSLSGVSVSLTNMDYLTGILGWLMTMFVFLAISEFYSAKSFSRYCRPLTELIDRAIPDNLLPRMMFVGSGLILYVLIFASILTAFGLAASDMILVVKTCAQRLMGA